MAPKSTTLRPHPKTRLVTNGRLSTKRHGGAPKGGNAISADQAEKLVRRYVAWLRNATPKQRRFFIDRFCTGLSDLPPCDGVQTLMSLKLLGYGPVTTAHAAVCNKTGRCDTCDNITAQVELTEAVCCHRGADHHSVVFN